MNTVQKLTVLGLTAKEAAVYLACLGLGESTVVAISEQARLPKTTAYEMLDRLKRRGLISVYRRKGKRYFAVTSPQALQDRAEEQTRVISGLLPELNSLYRSAARHSQVRFYEGEEGVRIVTKEILREAKNLIGIGSAEDIFSHPPELFMNFIRERVKRRIPVRVIYTPSPAARERQAADSRELKQTKIVKSDFPFTSLLLLWEGKFCLITLQNDYQVAVVEDKDMTAMIRAMWELIWQNVPEVLK